ncbi:MAG: hypothetical protein FWE85_00780 [Clostridiales bacterium]|nr:hypothetical protein [Clostridiales bacterium]
MSNNSGEKGPEKKGVLSALFGKDKGMLLKLGGILAAGLLLMFLSGRGFSGGGNTPPAGEEKGSAYDYRSAEQEWERQMEAVLSEIKGAGKVHVLITFASGVSKEYAVNVSESEREQSERSADGSGKESKESTHNSALAQENGKPVLITEYMPQVQGVLVVATGAGSVTVRQELFLAVQALLCVPAHRIVITQGK